MAEYQMQTSNLPNKDGEKKLFPRIKIWGQVDLDYLARRINYGSTFTPGDIIGVVKSLTQAIAREMGEGHSVKVDGLGVFTPSLGLREGFERESAEQGGQKRNVRSICVDNIRHSSSRYTAEQRLKLAQDYLESHPLLKVGDYSELTGLLRNAAAQELKQWSEMPESGIGHTGRGSHKIYIKETPQNQED